MTIRTIFSQTLIFSFKPIISELNILYLKYVVNILPALLLCTELTFARITSQRKWGDIFALTDRFEVDHKLKPGFKNTRFLKRVRGYFFNLKGDRIVFWNECSVQTDSPHFLIHQIFIIQKYNNVSTEIY